MGHTDFGLVLAFSVRFRGSVSGEMFVPEFFGDVSACAFSEGIFAIDEGLAVILLGFEHISCFVEF